MNGRSASVQEPLSDEVEAASSQSPPAPATNSDLELIRQAGQFDVDYYRSQAGRDFAPDDAIQHFLRDGERQRFNPCRQFDVAFYLATNPDVEKAGVNAYVHYLRHGRSEGRYPNSSALSGDALKALRSGQFDSAFYRSTYETVDYSRVPPVEHYLLRGWREGRRANSVFDAKFYADAYPDVRDSGLVPLLHYINIGARENRRTCLEHIKVDADLLHSSGQFDETFYRTANHLSDAEFERFSPAVHYVAKGARLWLDPSPAFSTEYYSRRYPDLIHAAANPFAHFIRFGKAEGRLGAKPSYDAIFKCARGEFLPSRPTLMVVLHECSLTGAPLLGLALVQELAKRYNIVVWAGRDGVLAEDLEVAAFLAGYKFPDPLDCEFVLRDLVANYPLDGVIANSVETSPVHRALLACDIPSVGLVHEFSAYTLPTGRLSTSISRLDRCVVPAELIKRSALREIEGIWGGSADNLVVQPQGQLPAQLWSSKFSARRDDDGDARPQLTEGLKGKKVVLGAGFFHMRKGVDLFIEVARGVREMLPGQPVHFLWVGDGYAPGSDAMYSVWLQEAIEKWRLEQIVTFLPGQRSIDWAFALADVFLLSSRLDPFPNVVVDAMAANVPVVCFEETTGCAEFIRRTGAAGAVVPYLDTRAAAGAIVRLLSVGRRASQSARVVETQLAMPGYVQVLERELKLAQSLVAERLRQCEEIDRARCFDRAFYDSHWKYFPDDRPALREYVAHSMKGIFRAAPYPGFNDGRYRAQHMPLATDKLIPLVHAIRHSAGKRPTSHDCLVVNGVPGVDRAAPPLRTAVHAHLFYPDLIAEFRGLLDRSGIAADLFISCANDAQAREIEYHLHGYKGGQVIARCVPNAGRDIGPFITEFGQELLTGGYDIAGHLHGKKSKVLGPKVVGDTWRNYLWDSLLGGDGAWETVHAAFAADPRLGLMFAEDRHIIGWTRNRAPAEGLKQRFGLSCGLPEIPVFPIGTMFWCRPQAIAAVLKSGLTWADYPSEPLPYDGTVLHAIERLLPTVCEQSGHIWKTIYLKGSNR